MCDLNVLSCPNCKAQLKVKGLHAILVSPVKTVEVEVKEVSSKSSKIYPKSKLTDKQRQFIMQQYLADPDNFNTKDVAKHLDLSTSEVGGFKARAHPSFGGRAFAEEWANKVIV